MGWSILLCIVNSVAIALLVRRDPALLLKPSIIFLLCFHLRVQWGAALLGGFIDWYLPNPADFFILAYVVPLATLPLACLTGRRSVARTWRRVRAGGIRLDRQTAVVLFGGVALITAYYLLNVPLGETGLYATFTEGPEGAALARAESLKLIEDPILRYAFAFMRSALAPIAAVIAVEMLLSGVRARKIARVAGAVVALAFLMIAVSLPGERANVGFVVLAVLASRLVVHGFRTRMIWLVTGSLAAISGPALLSMAREGQALSAEVYLTYLIWMVVRTFVEPVETGMWYVHYAQTNGFVGLAGIPKLAALVGIPPVMLDNVIGLAYASNPQESISAGTAFVFSYFSYFGMASIVLSPLLLLALDLVTITYDFVSTRLLVPLIVAIMLASFKLVEGDYTTVFLSGGLLMSVALALVVDRLPHAGKRTRRLDDLVQPEAAQP